MSSELTPAQIEYWFREALREKRIPVIGYFEPEIGDLGITEDRKTVKAWTGQEWALEIKVPADFC